MPLPVFLPDTTYASDGTAWHLTSLSIDALHAAGLRGGGITIAVVDTGAYVQGVALQHADVVALGRDGGTAGDDLDGHGTSMVAIMVGDGCAICPDAAIISLRAFTATGRSTAQWIADAIATAVSLGADIVNISGGQAQVSQVLADAVKAATDRGVVVVAAASNQTPDAGLYPACTPTAIAVTSSDSQAALVHPGTPSWVDIAAPGQNISTYEWDSPVQRSGTSEATAVVSAVCALLLGAAPSARRRELGAHLLGLLVRSATMATNASGPGDCGVIDPRESLAAVRHWLST